MSSFEINKASRPGRPTLALNDAKKGFTTLAKDLKALSDKRSTPLTRKRLEKQVDPKELRAAAFSTYANNAQLYAQTFFNTTLWEKQLEIVQALEEYNYVCVRSAHSTGKSYLLGILINYFFDTYYPLIGIGSAPTQKLVQNVMFAYARQFRNMTNGVLEDFWAGPRMPRIATGDNHYFEGIVTSDPTSMQGRHGPNVVLLLDEAVGIKGEMFEALESLMIGDVVKVLAIYNPTDPSSYVASVEKRHGWKTVTMSAYDHPNIWVGVERMAEGRAPTEDLPYPGAINLGRFEQLLKQWSDPITAQDYKQGKDIILPSSLLSDELQYFRPGPIAAARLLGRWPDTNMNNVFSEYDIENAVTSIVPQKDEDLITIGVDVARFGSDFSSFCVRHGNRVYELFEVNGLSTVEVAGRTVQLAIKYGEIFEVPYKSIDIAIDTIGIGAGVFDTLQDAGYNCHEVNVSERAFNQDKYANLRTELWFETHLLFHDKNINISRVDPQTRNELSKQLVAPLYKYDRYARRQLEPKDDTKKRIGRSPDLADALMLSYAVNSTTNTGITVSTEE